MNAIASLRVSPIKRLEIEKIRSRFVTYYYYYDYNKNNSLDGNDKEVIKLVIFTSSDGNKVREYYNLFNAQENEIRLFLETDNDTLSGNILLGKVAENLKPFLKQQITYNKDKFINSDLLDIVQTVFKGATKEIIEELFLNGYIEKKGIKEAVIEAFRFVFVNLFVGVKVLGWIVEKVGEGIDLLKISDKFWDDQNENYLFTKKSLLSSMTIDTTRFVNQVLHADTGSINNIIDIYGNARFEQNIDFFTRPVVKIADAYNAFVIQIVEEAFAGLENNSEITEEIKQVFALLAGLWNGLVDFVSSTLQFIGSILQVGHDIAANWQEFLETVDNIIDSFVNINLTELWEGIKVLYEKVKAYFKDGDDLNWVRISYIVGYSIAFVGTMFIPVAGWVGKIAKVDKLIPEELLAVLKKSGESLAGKLRTKSKQARLKILQQCDELLRIFTKGRQAIQEFFTKLADDIGAWLLKNRKFIQARYEGIVNLTSKELDWMASRNIGNLGGLIIKGSQIRKLRGILKNKGIQLIVDGDSKYIINLFKPVDDFKSFEELVLFMKNNHKVGLFHASTKQMILTKNCTEIVAFHEMCHLKHFAEVGEIAYKGFNKLEKEMYVWKQILANRGKWTEKELMSSLDYINDIRVSDYGLKALTIK